MRVAPCARNVWPSLLGHVHVVQYRGITHSARLQANWSANPSHVLLSGAGLDTALSCILCACRLPSKVQHCRLQLKRSPKTQITSLHVCDDGACLRVRAALSCLRPVIAPGQLHGAMWALQLPCSCAARCCIVWALLARSGAVGCACRMAPRLGPPRTASSSRRCTCRHHVEYIQGLGVITSRARAGVCKLGELLTFVATMYRNTDGSFDAKKYTFTLQVPDRPGATNTDKLLVFGTQQIDLADHAVFVGEGGRPMRVEIPLKTRPGRFVVVTGTVDVSIVQARMELDGMTSLSRPSTAAGPSGSFMNMDQARRRSHFCDRLASAARVHDEPPQAERGGAAAVLPRAHAPTRQRCSQPRRV
jgi:hypothetical protein